MNHHENTRQRARGTLLGQYIGDSLGSLVEFQTAQQIKHHYPNGVRNLADGGTWNLLAGQPTDDSQMAAELTHSLLDNHGYNQQATRANYQQWANNDPFDIGITISNALAGQPEAESQSNGALMRISPLAIYYAAGQRDIEEAKRFAKEDANITHLNEIVVDANVAYVCGIIAAIRNHPLGEIEETMKNAAQTQQVRDAITNGPAAYKQHIGWVLLSLSLAAQALRRSATIGAEEALIEVASFGGDTDTHAAIAGALLGAAHGAQAWPQRWTETVLNCKPDSERLAPGRRLAKRYWPTHLLQQADQLIGIH